MPPMIGLARLLKLPARRLRTHLSLVVLLALLPAVLTAIGTTSNGAYRARRMVDDRLHETAVSLARSVAHEIDTLTLFLVSMARSSQLDPPWRDAADPWAGFRQAAGRIAVDTAGTIALYAPDGALIFNTWDASSYTADLPALPGDIAGRVSRSSQPLVTTLAALDQSGSGIAVIIVPVIRDAVVIHLLAMELAPRRLSHLIDGPLREAGRFAAVLDETGATIAASLSQPTEQGGVGSVRRVRTTVPPEMLSGADDGTWTRVGMLDGVPRIMACAPLGQGTGWQVAYGEEAERVDSGLVATLLENLVATVLATIASLLLAGYLGGRLARPLRLLTSHARAVAIGTEPPREPVPPSPIIEFESLRQGMIWADAVLRRRGAAERMALREARTGHELLISVVNATAEHISVKDLELRYVLVNRPMLNLMQPPLEEWQVLGRKAADLLAPHVAQRLTEADRTALQTGRMTSFEMEVPRGAAPPQWRWITSTPWKDAKGRVVGVVTVSRDVTERRNSDARLRGLQADLLRATRLSTMGAMASGLAHELNQPLAAANNYVGTAQRLFDMRPGVMSEPERAGMAREAIEESAKQLLRAGSIVRRLRDFVGRGEAELELEDMGDIIRDACDLARRDGVPGGITLRAELAGLADGGGVVLADRTQIQQVLLNLVRNAAEAMVSHGVRGVDGALGGLGGPGHEGMIAITASVCSGSMTITISDNGPGIPDEIADRLFQPFVSTKQTGMGIGLVICHTIIEGHGGRLVHERRSPGEPAGSALFRITLPVPQHAGESA